MTPMIVMFVLDCYVLSVFPPHPAPQLTPGLHPQSYRHPPGGASLVRWEEPSPGSVPGLLSNPGQVRMEWGKQLLPPTPTGEPRATGAHLETREPWPQTLPRARPVGEGQWGKEGTHPASDL